MDKNKNKYLMLVPTNESIEIIKKYEEFSNKTRYLIRSITKNPDDYDEEYMKIKFNSDGELPLNKTIEISSMIIVVRAIFYKLSSYLIYKFSEMRICIKYKNGE